MSKPTVTRKGNIERIKNTETGEVTYRRVRANGTTRNLPILTGAERQQALAFRASREQGATMKAVAGTWHVSVSTVRRALNLLTMTETHEANLERANKLQQAKQAKRKSA